MNYGPLLALLTDFGNRDHYVGALKGVLLSACPDARIVDVAHELPAHDVSSAAFALASCYRFFPAGTLFVVVVDPGVGSSRRGLALEAGGWRFVGPDNGVFSLLLDEQDSARAHALANPSLWRPAVSATFHGRDVFAPVAAHLACGGRLDEVGPRVDDLVRLHLPETRRTPAGEWETTVLHVDRFGNLTTRLAQRELDEILADLARQGAELVIVVEGVVMPLARTYSDVANGEACALIGSSGRLEVAVHGGSAARLLGAGVGAPVRLRAASVRGLEEVGK